MTASAAMVKAMVVKGGGAGMAENSMTCAEICACFDPPIEFGPHSKMQGSLAGYQAEHIIPTSTFHVKGREGDRIPGCTGYSTPDALTWMVHDEQHAGTEHKRLTDPMRQFSQRTDVANGQATLKDWLDEYREGVKDALKNANPKRGNKRPDLDEDSLIEAAAECIRARAAEAFASMNPPVKEETLLRNAWKATKQQIKEAAEHVGDADEAV